MTFAGRPGLSPALALLVAEGRIRPQDRILDVGCGTGTDLLLLAKWGFRRLDGVDVDGRAVGAARARATRSGLSERVRFHPVAAERLTEHFGRRRFDVVLHTLVANNLRADTDAHFREVAAVMKPRGLLVVHERVNRRDENARPGKFPPLEEMARHFELSRSVATHIAERAQPGHARVMLWVGRPRRRRT